MKIAASFLIATMMAATSTPAGVLVEEDGILVQRVLVAAYLSGASMEPARRGMVEREVRQFESYLWRYSERHVRVEASLVFVGRAIEEDDLQGEDPRWGYALGLTSRVEEDLRQSGHDAARYDGLVLLFLPPASRPCRAAGLTWHLERYSSIPLKENLFEAAGHHYPLHLILVHEYLHQLDSAFEEAGRASGFEDPDRVGRAGASACVLPGDEYPFFATALQHDELCKPTDWRALDGRMGTWLPR